MLTRRGLLHRLLLVFGFEPVPRWNRTGRLGDVATLAPLERSALVTRFRLGSAATLPDEDLGPFPDDASLVRTRVVPDLIAGYYASPAGWAVVGYDVFPGRCGDLARYTGPGA